MGGEIGPGATMPSPNSTRSRISLRSIAKVTALRRALSLNGSLARFMCMHTQLPPPAERAVGQLAAGRVGLPVVGVLLEQDGVAFLPLHELERPGAHRVAAVGLALLL